MNYSCVEQVYLSYLVTGESDDALEVGLGDLRVADGALARGVVGQGQVVQDAGPAEDVAAPGIKYIINYFDLFIN